MCHITNMLQSFNLQYKFSLISLTGGDSWEAEPGWQGPLPLCEWWLERQRRRQVPPPRTARACSERPHLSELRCHPARTKQRDGSCKSQQTHTHLCFERAWLVLVQTCTNQFEYEHFFDWCHCFLFYLWSLLRCLLFGGWMLLMITYLKYMTTFFTQTGKTILTLEERHTRWCTFADIFEILKLNHASGSSYLQYLVGACISCNIAVMHLLRKFYWLKWTALYFLLYGSIMYYSNNCLSLKGEGWCPSCPWSSQLSSFFLAQSSSKPSGERNETNWNIIIMPELLTWDLI